MLFFYLEYTVHKLMMINIYSFLPSLLFHGGSTRCSTRFAWRAALSRIYYTRILEYVTYNAFLTSVYLILPFVIA
ncbi:hypothetical protein BJV82DRAFT_629953 [Fennellomyces sp. T-0311]|nr:hypothetical protein BJV82DRAFT_629953 [Fennellomyces sp. T-0311]